MKVIIGMAHPKTYMKDVFEDAIKGKHSSINFAEDELQYVYESLDKLQEIEEIVFDTNCLRPMEHEYANGFLMIEQILKEVK